MTPETQSQKIARLESNVEAGGRNYALLRAGSPKVCRNNSMLRATMLELIEEIGEVDDLSPLVEKLQDTLARPYRFDQDEPEEFALTEEPGPEDLEDRIAWLEDRLRAQGHAVYLLQLAGTRIVWNSDDLRATMHEIIEELEDVPDLHAIVEKLNIGLENGSD